MTNEEKFKEIFGITTGRLYNMPSSCFHKWESEKCAEQRTGRWVKDGVDYGEEFGGVYEFWCCDCCGEGSPDRYNYCPNCGAKMEGDT